MLWKAPADNREKALGADNRNLGADNRNLDADNRDWMW